MTAGPHRDRSISPQNAAAAGTSGTAIRYPMSVASPAGRSPPASLATMMPTSTSSRISRTPTAARRGTFIRRFRAVISSAYPASARPATMIVVGTAPFTDDMLLRFVVTNADGGHPQFSFVHLFPSVDLPRLAGRQRESRWRGTLYIRGQGAAAPRQ